MIEVHDTVLEMNMSIASFTEESLVNEIGFRVIIWCNFMLRQARIVEVAAMLSIFGFNDFNKYLSEITPISLPEFTTSK
jgi:hypothetical protein